MAARRPFGPEGGPKSDVLRNKLWVFGSMANRLGAIFSINRFDLTQFVSRVLMEDVNLSRAGGSKQHAGARIKYVGVGSVADWE